tara:strand:+ start:890 stop:1585 length:696 start_codon:yes stop_codon:yes gene_type:complete
MEESKIHSLDLLPSLAKVVRGSSILFWGLPTTLIVTVMSTMSNWTDAAYPMGMLLPSVAFGMLWYGLRLFVVFQPQERIWQNALFQAKLWGLTNLGLSPFLHWHHRAPDEIYFGIAVWLLAIAFVFYLMALNKVLARLSAMLPDETLRVESQLFSKMNRSLLSVIPMGVAFMLLLPLINNPPVFMLGILEFILAWRPLLFIAFVLIPLSMSMSLLWKTKESINASVFNSNR